ncbi:ankyrin repeat domain-containing protein [Actinomadura kijaniata]|uniref:ankyrin repeat domain-containing protein n=1 Tax=Actinomadura kijaniata TaxID=46161 RepID=UPI0008316525|nr:ankyrin repeat domain-containing protein [Actinomadura kijaniata]
MSGNVANDLRVWELVRRYAVPRWMIERATERRLAGDWRGACAAAHVDVEIDPADLTPEAEDDLRHLAPDLLRWHLPRDHGGTHIAVRRELVLGEYGGAVLYAATPRARNAPQIQRLRLRLDRKAPGRYRPADPPVVREDWSGLRHLWDARRVGGLLDHHGPGGRLPFLCPDGVPLADGELPAADPGPGDPAARSEWVFLLRERGDLDGAITAAGLTAVEPRGRPGAWRTMTLVRHGLTTLDLSLLARAGRSLAGTARVRADVSPRHCLVLERVQGRLTLSAADPRDVADVPVLPEPCWRTPDPLLLRAGRITPEELHPLVRAAVFPARPPAGPPPPAPLAPVRIRCRGERHEARWRGGRLDVPHPAGEHERERALRALGGTMTGCFAVTEAWTSGRGGLPPALEALREEIFLRMEHGDTPGVLRLLEEGVDPRVRDGDGRTLLHLVYLADHEVLLPRLLAAGLDLEAEDGYGGTPLYRAVLHRASAGCVRALVDAGARIDVVNEGGWSLRDLINTHRYAHLYFLRDRIAAEHPGLGRGLPDGTGDDG